MSDTPLLPRNHTILEKGLMAHRPFGTEADGRKIRDVSGMTIRAHVEYLEEVVARGRGPEVGIHAVEVLCRRLNERIRDPAYHVTPAFLKNMWHSYSYEFTAYLAEFCIALSGEADFAFRVGKHKFLSPTIQTLGRPFSIPQIYKMFSHFGEKFVKGSLHLEAVAVTDCSARLRMKFTEAVERQFGPYLKACAAQVCWASKGGLVAVPELIHQRKPATVRDLSCMAYGDEYCEWEFTWEPDEAIRWPWLASVPIGSLTLFAAGAIAFPQWSLGESLVFPLAFLAAGSVGAAWHLVRRRSAERDRLIQEQVASMETRHEELREAYLDLEGSTVELRRRLGELTTLHRTGLLFASTRDREALYETVLQALLHDLHYDRALLSRWLPDRQTIKPIRIVGVSHEVEAFLASLEIPVSDPSTVEGVIFLRGEPVLLTDLADAWERLHPAHRELARLTHSQCFVSVPLKVRGRIVGALTVNRTDPGSLSQSDLNVLMTLGNQVAIALDNAEANAEIEALNQSLEAKVAARTGELERANRALADANGQLRELDHLKSAFVSIVSHELRTPMTAIKGYVENLLDGLGGPVNDKQIRYLQRIKANADRLTRMTNELLDLSRIESGAVHLEPVALPLDLLAQEVLESLQPMARDRGLTLHLAPSPCLPDVTADRDKLTQILTNLVQNAIKFTPPGGEVRLELGRTGGRFAHVSVIDTGIGIAPDELEKIFDRFYRSDSAPHEARGAGLGLTITKSLIELQGGRIEVTSTPGGGSRFSFTIPLAGADGATAETGSALSRPRRRAAS